MDPGRPAAAPEPGRTLELAARDHPLERAGRPIHLEHRAAVVVGEPERVVAGDVRAALAVMHVRRRARERVGVDHAAQRQAGRRRAGCGRRAQRDHDDRGQTCHEPFTASRQQPAGRHPPVPPSWPLGRARMVAASDAFVKTHKRDKAVSGARRAGLPGDQSAWPATAASRGTGSNTSGRWSAWRMPGE